MIKSLAMWLIYDLIKIRSNLDIDTMAVSNVLKMSFQSAFCIIEKIWIDGESGDANMSV